MTKYFSFLWTCFRAYQGDPQAAKDVLVTVAAKVREKTQGVQS